jgi:hypothetical protein
MYCLCVNVYCHRVSTKLQLTNISISIISIKEYRDIGDKSYLQSSSQHATQVTGHFQDTVTLPLGQEPNHADQGSIRGPHTEASTYCRCVHVSPSHIGQTLNSSHHNSDTNHTVSDSTYHPSRITTRLRSMPC